MPSQGVTNVANAIINKINNLISSHNSNENAHQDIRESIPSATSELNNNSGFITSSSVPNPSSTTPSADTTNGSVGDGTTWARSNHTHPRSSLYAEANHTHDSIYPAYEIDNLNVDDVHYAAGRLHYESFSNAIYYSDVDEIGIIDKELAVKGDLPTIIDNLTTNDATKVLSAKQGKVLNDDINNVESDVSNLQTSVNSLSDSITNLTGFTRVYNGYDDRIRVSTNGILAYFIMQGTFVVNSSGTSSTGSIPSQYAPTAQTTIRTHPSGSDCINLGSDGKITYYANSGKSTSRVVHIAYCYPLKSSFGV